MIDYSDLSFIEIAEALGFCSQSYFILSFKKIVGETPKRYQDSIRTSALTKKSEYKKER